MRIIVCVKQICHIYARTGMDPGQSFVAPEDRIYRINPYDEAAVEAAVRIKELLGEGEISILILGPIICEAELRRCLAMGADHLYQIDMNDKMDPWRKSGLLASAVKKLEADLVFCGKESMDNQNGQVGAFIAHRLGMPFVSSITDCMILKDKSSASVRRRAGRGRREVVECPLPAVFSADLRFDEIPLPAYVDKKRARTLPIQKLVCGEEVVCAKTISARIFPPRPRPKRVTAPDSRLESYDRIQQLLSGSRVEKKGLMLRGSPESQTEGIISFLKEHGFLETEKRREEE